MAGGDAFEDVDVADGVVGWGRRGAEIRVRVGKLIFGCGGGDGSRFDSGGELALLHFGGWPPLFAALWRIVVGSGWRVFVVCCEYARIGRGVRGVHVSAASESTGPPSTRKGADRESCWATGVERPQSSGAHAVRVCHGGKLLSASCSSPSRSFNEGKIDPTPQPESPSASISIFCRAAALQPDRQCCDRELPVAQHITRAAFESGRPPLARTGHRPP